MNTRYVSSLRRVLVCAALAASIGLQASFAVAEQAPQREVKYRRSELATEAGAAHVYARLQNAAREVCRGYHGLATDDTPEFRACYSKALDDAVASLNHRTVNRLHHRAEARSARVRQPLERSAS
jgi:UrcA family protein